MRAYDHATDFEVIRQRLSAWYRPGDHPTVWHPARWSYMHFHPNIDDIDLTSIGVATDGGEIIGVVHPEHTPAFAHLQVNPATPDAVGPLLDWAEGHLGGWSRTLERDTLGFWVADCASSTIGELTDRGYTVTSHEEPESLISLSAEPADAPLPGGYRLATLAEDNDLHKINRVLWRGFNHPGPAPDDQIPGRLRIQQAPGFRADRTVVVVAPNGTFASYAGVWLDEVNRVAYLEPVATDPDHRRRGLGRAAVTRALRLAQSDGATVAIGGDQAFYRAMGFRVTCRPTLYVRSP